MVLSSSQHHPLHHDEGKPDILLPECLLSTTVVVDGEPSEVKVEVPSSPSSSLNPGQEAMKKRGSEGLPLSHWVRQSLSVLQNKQSREEELEEVNERDATAGKDEWREAGALLRKIGDLLDNYTWVSTDIYSVEVAVMLIKLIGKI